MPHLKVPITRAGALVPVIISRSTTEAAELTRQGQRIPDPLPVLALIDIGSGDSFISARVVAHLEPATVGSEGRVSLGTGSKEVLHSQFQVDMTLPHHRHILTARNFPVLQADCDCQGFPAVLGRDFLGTCVVVYDGEHGICTLCF